MRGWLKAFAIHLLAACLLAALLVGAAALLTRLQGGSWHPSQGWLILFLFALVLAAALAASGTVAVGGFTRNEHRIREFYDAVMQQMDPNLGREGTYLNVGLTFLMAAVLVAVSLWQLW